MDGSNKTKSINRQSAAGMTLCVSGLGLLLWTVVSQVLGAAHQPMLLFVALPILAGLGLLVAGFALMVAGAVPFDDDGGGGRDDDDPQ